MRTPDMWKTATWDPGDYPVERLVLEKHMMETLLADHAIGVPIKCDVDSMELPIFSLSKRADRRITVLMHPDGKRGVKIYPGALGRPTIFDKDPFLFCVSQVVDDHNRGLGPCRRVRFPCKNLLDWVGRAADGRSYRWLKNALRRLGGVKVERVKIDENGKWVTEIFGLVGDIWWHTNGGKVGDVEVELSERVLVAMREKRVLTYPKDYYNLTSPNERRMYEIARRFCGTRNPETLFNIDTLHFQFGSTAGTRKFRQMIKRLVKDQNIPQYHIEYNDGVPGGQVRIIRRADIRTVAHPHAPPSLWKDPEAET